MVVVFFQMLLHFRAPLEAQVAHRTSTNANNNHAIVCFGQPPHERLETALVCGVVEQRLCDVLIATRERRPTYRNEYVSSTKTLCTFFACDTKLRLSAKPKRQKHTLGERQRSQKLQKEQGGQEPPEKEMLFKYQEHPECAYVSSNASTDTV